MSIPTTPLCLRHWDFHESRSATDPLRVYEMTSGDRTVVFNWVDDVIAYYRAKPIVGEHAKRATLFYLQNYGLRRAWLQAIAAMCMLFYEKLEDCSVLRLSLDKMQRVCDYQYSKAVLVRIETRIAAMHFQAQESTVDD